MCYLNVFCPAGYQHNRLFASLLPCVQNSHAEVANTLIESGADIDTINNSNDTPLIVACWQELKSSAQLLIMKGANLNRLDREGGAALMICACHAKKVNLAKILIIRGADVLVVNQHGDTALTLSLRNKLKCVAETLIEKGADVHTITSLSYD